MTEQIKVVDIPAFMRTVPKMCASPDLLKMKRTVRLLEPKRKGAVVSSQLAALWALRQQDWRPRAEGWRRGQ